jgi:hypothetical protein
MMKIMKAVEYMDKELKHAYKFLECAIEAKTESPELFEIYMKIAENEAMNAESIHTVIVRMIERASLNKDNEPPKAMKDIWNWKHKDYIEEYAHFKTKLDAMKKLM